MDEITKQAEIEKLRAERDDLRAQLDDLLEERENLRAERDKLEEECDRYVADAKRLAEELNEARSDRNDQTLRANALAADNENLGERLAILSHENAHLHYAAFTRGSAERGQARAIVRAALAYVNASRDCDPFVVRESLAAILACVSDLLDRDKPPEGPDHV